MKKRNVMCLLLLIFAQNNIMSSECNNNNSKCSSGSCNTSHDGQSGAPTISSLDQRVGQFGSLASDSLTRAQQLALVKMQRSSNKFLEFFAKSKEFYKKADDRAKLFIKILAFAAAVWKRDKLMSLFMAIKAHLWANKFPYALISFFVHGVQKNLIILNPSRSLLSAPEVLDEHLRRLPGENYLLDINQPEHYSKKALKAVIYDCQKRGKPFTLAKVSTYNDNGCFTQAEINLKNSQLEVYHCDSRNLHQEIFRDIFDVAYPVNMRLQFVGKGPRLTVAQVHYFNLNILTGDFAFVGSNYDLLDENPNQEKMLNHFVDQAIANEDIYTILTEFQNSELEYINSNTNDLQVKRYIKILNRIIAKQEESKECSLRARYILASIYQSTGNKEKAKDIINACDVTNKSHDNLIYAINQLKRDLGVG